MHSALRQQLCGDAADTKENDMAGDTLREALVEEIRDIYNAEKQLVKALPKMAKGATSDELRDAFECTWRKPKAR